MSRGAGGTTGSLRGARATPDGYTLLVGQMGTHAASVGLYGDKLGYDPVNDFEHVSQFAGHADRNFREEGFSGRTLQELVARLKADGAKLTNGHGGVGSTSQVSCLLFSSIVGAKRDAGRLSRFGARAQRPDHRAISISCATRSRTPSVM